MNELCHVIVLKIQIFKERDDEFNFCQTNSYINWQDYRLQSVFKPVFNISQVTKTALLFINDLFQSINKLLRLILKC